MANVSLQPDAGRAEHRGADRARRARPLRRRRQELVDRHAALQLPVHRAAVLQDRRRRARRPGPRRRLPGDHHRLLELHGGRGRPRHLGPRRRLQLRQGPARAGRQREPRLPDRRCSAASASSTPPTRQASDERSSDRHLDPAVAGRARARHHCRPTTASSSSATPPSANLRWANNTLTTNGVMHGVTVTVVSFVRRRGGRGHRLGHRQRELPGPGDRARARPPTPRPAAGSPAEDANDLVAGDAAADWDDGPGPHRHPRVRRVRAGPG